ncbi:dihydropteroate synthase [Flavobacteriaceae bacterium S0825]|uniref:dihydropteroate synthase n=1 Tax=Gaetbulibacter sp. S0825 TaxID=2720084 RepID=UPI00143021B3|nr:dihydropteroate synthase [Gaetbulibacter sp. S0825]MCK0108871.1 dihydropteroate synthase [Flavobacteriaceae bacterium S0825]NIX64507.1 dihydropteroate synthase [Gaetbulibacter sp. S0825]
MTINCKGTLIDLSTPKVMGILNITPDSFYDGGRYKNDASILNQVENMLSEGATFIDVGAYSSRPGANHVSEAEELKRIIPIVELLIKQFPSINLSIDTFRSNIANECINLGAAIINDISGGKLDKKMLETVGKRGVPYVMMHMKGTPQTMQQHTDYNDLIKDIIYYFSERVAEARSHKINDIIIDPGFGFSKTLEQNYSLLNHLELLNMLEQPMLVGVSRKSMIYQLLDTNPNEALNGTTSLNTIALLKGAKILRVHDVNEAMECIKLTNQLN